MNQLMSEIKGSDQFMTPPDWIELARSCMSSIDFDPASNAIAQQYVKANYWAAHPVDFEKEKYNWDNVLCDGLTCNWEGNVWCNPPYSGGNIDAFVNKAITEWITPSKSSVNQMLILVNSATDTNWYHRLLVNCTAALLVKGRIKFWKMFDGDAHAVWEGELSKKRRAANPELKPKVGNSPRYLNTLFYYSRANQPLQPFIDTFGNKGKIIRTLG